VPHDEVTPAWQVPAPLHVRVCVYVSPVQASGAHVVPAAYFSQAPAPSHAPFVPQVLAP
jgi:hypothetical protein